jgi:hypothetical protein
VGFLCPLGLGWMGRGPPQTKRLIIDQLVTYTSHVPMVHGDVPVGCGVEHIPRCHASAPLDAPPCLACLLPGPAPQLTVPAAGLALHQLHVLVLQQLGLYRMNVHMKATERGRQAVSTALPRG